jgi:hypothetical protein
MNPFAQMPIREVLSRIKLDLKSLHSVVKNPLDLSTWPEIVKLTRDILNCSEKLSPCLQEPLKTDLLGLVEDFDDYRLEAPQQERHELQNYLNNNLRSVIERLDQITIEKE